MLKLFSRILSIIKPTTGLTPLEELVRNYRSYEKWVAVDDCDPKRLPKYFPKEYFHLFGQNPLAYEWYRHNLYGYVEEALGEGAHLEEIWQLWLDVKTTYPAEAERLLTMTRDADFRRRYSLQQSNVYEIQLNRPVTKIYPEALHTYQTMYENEGILEFLATAAKINNGQGFDPTLIALRDHGRLVKGRALNQIKPCLNRYQQLHALFGKAYDAKLRNTIGHNDYQLIDQGQALRSLDGKIYVTAPEFLASLYALQQLHHAFFWVVNIMDLQDQASVLADQGILAIAWDLENRQLICYQLWCFSALDPAKNWMREAVVKLANGEVRTTFTGTVYATGPLTPGLRALLADLNTPGQTLCKLIPIAPYLGHRELINLRFGCFEQIEQPIIKEIALSLSP